MLASRIRRFFCLITSITNGRRVVLTSRYVFAVRNPPSPLRCNLTCVYVDAVCRHSYRCVPPIALHPPKLYPVLQHAR